MNIKSFLAASVYFSWSFYRNRWTIYRWFNPEQVPSEPLDPITVIPETTEQWVFWVVFFILLPSIEMAIDAYLESKK